MSGQLHVPAALPQGKKKAYYTQSRRLDDPQDRSGRLGGEKNLLPLTGIELQFFGYHLCIYSSVTFSPASLFVCLFVSNTLHFLVAFFLYVTRPSSVSLTKLTNRLTNHEGTSSLT